MHGAAVEVLRGGRDGEVRVGKGWRATRGGCSPPGPRRGLPRVGVAGLSAMPTLACPCRRGAGGSPTLDFPRWRGRGAGSRTAAALQEAVATSKV